jgi:hypothetical protein
MKFNYSVYFSLLVNLQQLFRLFCLNFVLFFNFIWLCSPSFAISDSKPSFKIFYLLLQFIFLLSIPFAISKPSSQTFYLSLQFILPLSISFTFYFPFNIEFPSGFATQLLWIISVKPLLEVLAEGFDILAVVLRLLEGMT